MDELALHFRRSLRTGAWSHMTLDTRVLVNSAPVSCCVLRDRDLIEVPDEGPVLYAAEIQPRVELQLRFPGPVSSKFCLISRRI